MRTRYLVLGVAASAALVAGSAVPAFGGGGADRPGVTPTEIRVGGVVGKTNPIGRPYQDAFTGVRAYFDVVNRQGGVHGRKLRLVAQLDDQSRASQNISAVRSLVEEKKVFAVLPVVTQIFAGAAYLADKGVPTFGWNINPEWSKGPSLFGEKGSYLCFDCSGPYLPWVAEQLGAERVAIMSYTAPSSKACAEGQRKSYEKYGPELVYEDTSLNFGFTDLSADVQAIKDKDVQLISTCMDVNGNVNIARALRQAGVDDVTIFSPEGYDPSVPKKFGDDLDNFLFRAAFVPFEAAKGAPGMKRFLGAMKKRGAAANELALTGWINAMLLVDGLEAAGKDVTRQSLVDAINTMTDFTADGILPGVDWTVQHAALNPDQCTATLRVRDGRFRPTLGKPGKPFVCFPSPEPDSLIEPTYQ